MKNLFENLELLEGETKFAFVSEYSTSELSGVFRLQKGNFIQEFYYWGRVYEKFKDIVQVEDYDYEWRDCSLGSMPIDNLQTFKDTLKNAGLSTLSNKLGFNDEEILNGMYTHIKKHKSFNLLFDKKAKIFNAMSQKEKDYNTSLFVIENYDTCGDYLKQNCGIHLLDDEGKKIIPTLEQITENLQNLI
jgi:hypothetical protein